MNLEFKIIDQESVWNGFLAKTNDQAFFQDYLWNGIYKNSGIPSWTIGIFESDKLIGLALLNLIKAKRGTFLHLRHGPVADINILLNQDFWQKFLKYIKTEFTKYGIWWLRISPQVEPQVETQKLLSRIGFRPSPIHAMDAELCWILDITLNEEKLLSDMRKTTRYLVKKATSLGVEIKESSDFGIFQKLYSETAQRQGFIEHKDIEAEWEIFFRAKRAFMLIASYEKQVLAAGIFIRFGSQVIYRHGASVKSNVPASYLLQWEAIRKAKKLGAELYNFWGIAPVDKPHHPWRGITLFKQGFGGEMREFMHAHDLALTPLYAVSYIIETVRKVRRGY